jgi:hypothetical protein
MAIRGCGSPAHCCQPAVAGGIIYADLRSELNTHLAPQALFTQSSPVLEPLLQAFPFPSTLGEVTLHPLSQAGMFIYSSHGKWFFPCSPVAFSSHCHFYKLSHSWLLGVCHCSCLLQPACCEGFPLPPFSAQGTPPSLRPVFFVVIAYYSVFFLFSLGGGRSVQGPMLIWPRVVCGSTTCHLAHLVVCIFPSCLGAAIWLWHGNPPGFSV